MEKCPKCGSEGGYYEKQIKYYTQYFYWDGSVSHASDGKNYGGTRRYCVDCDKDVTKYIP